MQFSTTSNNIVTHDNALQDFSYYIIVEVILLMFCALW